MRSLLFGGIGLALALGTSGLAAQETAFRPVRNAAPVQDIGVTLGRPTPLAGGSGVGSADWTHRWEFR